jgi:hypothetical protein
MVDFPAFGSPMIPQANPNNSPSYIKSFAGIIPENVEGGKKTPCFVQIRHKKGGRPHTSLGTRFPLRGLSTGSNQGPFWHTITRRVKERGTERKGSPSLFEERRRAFMKKTGSNGPF